MEHKALKHSKRGWGTQVTSGLEKDHLVILNVQRQISVSSFIPGEG